MIVKFVKSMGYAIKGIALGIKEERNMRIDLVAMFYVLFFSAFYSFNITQRVLLVFICFVVPAFELMNTAIERAVDRPDRDHYIQAGQAKDAAAGAVLLAATGAAVAGVMLFWDVEIFKKIFEFFTADIIRPAAFGFSVVLSYLFIICDKLKKK